ncbi:hypothetical protein LAJ55_15895, partial [Streptococcus pneumoniae]|uniref:hypothetical protein n=1 Tax=Streptococcus pneumoniae TaxID=1313 RepID=UPI001CBAE1CE
TFPSNFGSSFSSTGAPAIPSMNSTVGSASTPNAGGVGITDGQPAAPTGVAGQYMNPYLQAVLDPQLAELRRQNDITN